MRASINIPLANLCFVRTKVPTNIRAAVGWKAWRCLYANRDPLIDCSTTRTPTRGTITAPQPGPSHRQLPKVNVRIFQILKGPLYCRFKLNCLIAYIVRKIFELISASSSYRTEFVPSNTCRPSLGQRHVHVILRLLHPARVRLEFELAKARSILLFDAIAVEQAAHRLFRHISAAPSMFCLV